MAEIVATNAYRAELAARAVSGATSLVPYKVAFGNGDRLENITDTALQNELFRVNPDSVTSTGVTLSVEVSIDFADAGDTPFCEIGVFAQNGASEILMGRKVFVPKTLSAPDRSVFKLDFIF